MGEVYLIHKERKLIVCIKAGNTAAIYGGAVIVAYSSFFSSPLSTVVFERNVVGKFGGGMFSINQIPSTGAILAGSVSFINNTAESGGGVAFLKTYLHLEGNALFQGLGLSRASNF